MKRLKAVIAVEFIGTLCLCLSVLFANVLQPTEAPLIIGLFLIALVYAGYNVSGSQFNPIVSGSIKILSIIKMNELIGVLLAQIIAAILAYYICLVDGLAIDSITDHHPDVFHIMAMEIIGTFILVWVILEVATVEKNIKKGVYGLAIGMTVAGISYLFSPSSGATFNPAVLVSTVLAGWVKLSDIPYHLLGQVVGGLGATYFFKYTQI